MINKLLVNKLFKKLSVLLMCLGIIGLSCGFKTGVLNPKGSIALEQEKLLIDAVVLMLIVVIPVIIMSFAFAFQYRAKNKKARYEPSWSHSVLLESIWWGIPCVIILILGVLTWTSTHKLDPYRPIDSSKKPVIIEAVALRWKWLFIYPKHNIATVNYVELPVNRPVRFLITSDNAPMNAFFIPQLGSQIYAMAGMQTKLNLLPTHEGVYKGFSSNYSGEGFSDMKFKVHVKSEHEYETWINQVKKSSHSLYLSEYAKLVQPSEADSVVYYSRVTPKLYDKILMQYMKPNMNLYDVKKLKN